MPYNNQTQNRNNNENFLRCQTEKINMFKATATP